MTFDSLPTLEELKTDYPPRTCPVCLYQKDEDVLWTIATFTNGTGQKRVLPICVDCRNEDLFARSSVG
jgi:hypothetical protein